MVPELIATFENDTHISGSLYHSFKEDDFICWIRVGVSVFELKDEESLDLLIDLANELKNEIETTRKEQNQHE